MSLAQRVEELHELDASHSASIRSLHESITAAQESLASTVKKLHADSSKRSCRALITNENGLSTQRGMWEKLETDVALLRTHLAAGVEEKRKEVETHSRRRVHKEEHLAKCISAAKGTYVRQERTKRESWMGTEMVVIQQGARKATEPEIAMLLHQQREELRRRRQERELDLVDGFQGKESALEKEEHEVRALYGQQTLTMVDGVRKETQNRLEDTGRRVMESAMEIATQTYAAKRRVREEFWAHERRHLQEDRGSVREERSVVIILPTTTLPIIDDHLDDTIENDLDNKIQNLRATHHAALETQKQDATNDAMSARDASLQLLVGQFETLGVDLMGIIASERRSASGIVRKMQSDVERMREAISLRHAKEDSFKSQESELRGRMKDISHGVSVLLDDTKKELEEMKRVWGQTVREAERNGRRAMAIAQDATTLVQRIETVSDTTASEIGEIDTSHEAMILEMKERVTAQCLKLQKEAEELSAEKVAWETRGSAAEAELKVLENFYPSNFISPLNFLSPSIYIYKKKNMYTSYHIGKGHTPGVPWLSSIAKRRGSANKVNNYSGDAWRAVQNPYGARRPSFWVSDFHHRYLLLTGNDYVGRVPMSPPPGTYQTANHKMLKNELPQRDTRALPVRPLHPRVVFEHGVEMMSLNSREESVKRKASLTKQQEDYWDFFKKVQMVRANWNRKRHNRSRGVYKPVIDATEIWG